VCVRVRVCVYVCARAHMRAYIVLAHALMCFYMHMHAVANT